MKWDYFWYKTKHDVKRYLSSAKWIVIAVVVGLIVGMCAIAFSICLDFVTGLRAAYPWLLFLLPVGGLVIMGLYTLLRDVNDGGTNLVIQAIHSGDELPFRMAPLIFISTLITHLCGGSAGREGAALQIGGSIGNTLGKLFHFDDKDIRVMIMCGMSAAFAGLFGTPMAAAIFSMEMISVGVMYYNALVPCVISSFVAHGLAELFGIEAETFLLEEIPAFTIANAIRISILAILCALLSILFCVVLHQTEHLYQKFLTNRFLRIFVAGCVIVVVTLLIGNQRYNGSGMNIIEDCFAGNVLPQSFLLKIALTALTIGAGFKGGEIVPSFCTGAAFGCLFGQIIGFSPSLCAAVGMSAVFCGVTNCPITSLLISFELFGYEGMPFFLLSIALSYMLSGYFGLYRTQKIVYSKYKTNYINKSTN